MPKILLVEDYPANVLVATTILEMLNVEYATASNGAEAVARTGAEDFDLVLMDVQMPDMDGFTATRMIREAAQTTGRKRVPIIGVTAHALKGDRERCLAAGMDDYLAKPFAFEALGEKIAQWAPQAMSAESSEAVQDGTLPAQKAS